MEAAKEILTVILMSVGVLAAVLALGFLIWLFKYLFSINQDEKELKRMQREFFKEMRQGISIDVRSTDLRVDPVRRKTSGKIL
jgi:hypothetical protein